MAGAFVNVNVKVNVNVNESGGVDRGLGGSDGGELVAGGWLRVAGNFESGRRKAEKSMGPEPSLHG